MAHRSQFVLATLAATITVAGSLTWAGGQQPPSNTKPTPPKATTPTKQVTPPSGDQVPQLPPGMTEADMQACMEAATPGENHAQLAKCVGVWNGKTTMWMTPEAKPEHSECVATTTAVMDGRYFKCEITGDMPGMGPFNGFGLYGFDNVSKKFQSTWIDNCSTGMMTGTGELSSDGKTMTWSYNYHCPITKKLTTMREIEGFTGKDTKTMEMWGQDPHTGKEFKMMEIAFIRKGGTATAVAPTSN